MEIECFKNVKYVKADFYEILLRERQRKLFSMRPQENAKDVVTLFMTP